MFVRDDWAFGGVNLALRMQADFAPGIHLQPVPYTDAQTSST